MVCGPAHHLRPGAAAAVAAQAGWFDLLGGSPPPLPAEQADFIHTLAARHLDPYLDGVRAAPQAGERLFLPAVRSDYAATHGGAPLPAPDEAVLALYVRHAIGKANSIHCFGELLMGEGRPPVLQPELDAHLRSLAKALAEAIGRDFGTGAGREYRLGGVALDQALLEEAARRHAAELYATQHRLGESLAKANEAGEVGRRAELRRIFGFEC